jgi:hypothetical protein
MAQQQPGSLVLSILLRFRRGHGGGFPILFFNALHPLHFGQLMGKMDHEYKPFFP